MSFNILGTGICVPEKIVTNDEMAAIVDTSDKWIRQRVGIAQRRICTTETATDLAVGAAKAALADAGVQPGELDLILSATVSGDNVSPSIACMVQNRLGAACPAYEINAACAAFLFLLETAAGYFARGRAKKVLIIGAERLSGITDYTDRSTCVIFGDGAGAAVLGEGDGYVDSVQHVSGGDDVLLIPRAVGASPFYKNEGSAPFIQMKGQDTFRYAVTSITSDVNELLERNSLTAEDIAFVVPHQANIRIIDFACRKLKIPMEKFVVNIDRYGNTSSASIPIALDELAKSGKLNRGDKIILTAFGAGLASAACLITW